MENKRINEVGFKGQLRKCTDCGDVKIWDYPNERQCPEAINPNRPRHRWRPIKDEWLSEEENKSIDRQVEADKKINHRCSIIYNHKE